MIKSTCASVPHLPVEAPLLATHLHTANNTYSGRPGGRVRRRKEPAGVARTATRATEQNCRRSATLGSLSRIAGQKFRRGWKPSSGRSCTKGGGSAALGRLPAGRPLWEPNSGRPWCRIPSVNRPRGTPHLFVDWTDERCRSNRHPYSAAGFCWPPLQHLRRLQPHTRRLFSSENGSCPGYTESQELCGTLRKLNEQPRWT